jgi:hypothetical protein
MSRGRAFLRRYYSNGVGTEVSIQNLADLLQRSQAPNRLRGVGSLATLTLRDCVHFC